MKVKAETLEKLIKNVLKFLLTVLVTKKMEVIKIFKATAFRKHSKENT